MKRKAKEKKEKEKIILPYEKEQEQEHAYYHVIIALANSIEARDSYTISHTLRVTRIAESIAKYIDWSKDKIKQIRLGGILHDIGKIGIKDTILQKPGKLTLREKEEMQKHPEIGANLVKKIKFLKPVIPFILSHQERFDGKGYPYKLKAKQIPIEGRLMAVADAFDAMTSNRPYRKAMDREKALQELISNKGKQFDPEMVDAFCDLYKKGTIGLILDKFKQKNTMHLCTFCSSIKSLKGSKTGNSFFSCPGCGEIRKY